MSQNSTSGRVLVLTGSTAHSISCTLDAALPRGQDQRARLKERRHTPTLGHKCSCCVRCFINQRDNFLWR